MHPPAARRLLSALAIGAVLLLLVGPAADAYVGQNPYSVHLDVPAGTSSCQSTVVVTATVRSATSGVLVGNQVVEWDVMVAISSADNVSPTTSVTGADGQASTTLHFGNVGGQRTVRATIATWPATIDVACTGPTPPPSTTLPTPTSTSVTPTPAAPTPTPEPSLGPSDSPPASPASTPAPVASESIETPSAAPGISTPAATVAPTIQPSSAGTSSSGPDPLLIVIGVVFVLACGGLVLALRARR